MDWDRRDVRKHGFLNDMTISSYSLQSLWRGILRDIPHRKASFFISSLIAPVIMWLALGMAVKFDSRELVRTSIPVLIMTPIGILSAVILRSTRGRRIKDGRSQRITALIHGIYYGVALISLSAYFLRIAIETGQRYLNLPFQVYPGLLALYLLSGLAAAAWSPSSIPRTQADDDLAFRRGIRWLPWAMGIQGSLIGFGVFLSAWLMHNEVAWEGLLVVGVASLCATVLLMVTVLGFYRFLVLALYPIPKEIQEEFGLRS